MVKARISAEQWEKIKHEPGIVEHDGEAGRPQSDVVEPMAMPSHNPTKLGNMKPSTGSKYAGQMVGWKSHKGYDAGNKTILAKAVDIGKKAVHSVIDKKPEPTGEIKNEKRGEYPEKRIRKLVVKPYGTEGNEDAEREIIKSSRPRSVYGGGGFGTGSYTSIKVPVTMHRGVIGTKESKHRSVDDLEELDERTTTRSGGVYLSLGNPSTLPRNGFNTARKTKSMDDLVGFEESRAPARGSIYNYESIGNPNTLLGGLNKPMHLSATMPRLGLWGSQPPIMKQSKQPIKTLKKMPQIVVPQAPRTAKSLTIMGIPVHKKRGK